MIIRDGLWTEIFPRGTGKSSHLQEDEDVVETLTVEKFLAFTFNLGVGLPRRRSFNTRLKLFCIFEDVIHFN